MSKVVISDTSCFIAFDHINQLEILRKLFGSVLTTPTILEEFGKSLPSWVAIEEPTNQHKQLELEYCCLQSKKELLMQSGH